MTNHYPQINLAIKNANQSNNGASSAQAGKLNFELTRTNSTCARFWQKPNYALTPKKANEIISFLVNQPEVSAAEAAEINALKAESEENEFGLKIGDEFEGIIEGETDEGFHQVMLLSNGFAYVENRNGVEKAVTKCIEILH